MQTVKEKSFVVYQASAGSGKTFNLAKEFIKICLLNHKENKQTYRNILAITFTNKAVGEMKERILRFLEELAQEKNELLLEQLDIPIPKELIVEYSTDILQRIHHDYSNLSICTIDSLFQKLLQSFAVDLQIPINHKLELDTQTLMQMIVDLILSRLGYDKALTNTILNYSYSRIENEKNWQIEKDLIDIGQQIYQESAIIHLNKIKNIDSNCFSNIINTIFERLSNTKKAMQSIAQNAITLLTTNGLNCKDLYRGDKGIGKKFENIAQGKFTVKDLEINSYIQETIEEDKWCASNSQHKNIISYISNELKEFYTEIIDKKDEYLLYTAISKNIYAVALLNEISRTAELIKESDKIMHISEANFRIFENIGNEAIPYIFERMGERYNYVFIDEFQDTSSMQWQNLLPFVVEIISMPIKGEEMGKAIIFGDSKQAIYRFRGGNVRQFADLPHIAGSENNLILKEREEIINAHFQKICLKYNFRSKQKVVEFNNRFFASITSEFAHDIYEDCIQDNSKSSEGGGVSLSFLLKPDKDSNQINSEDITNQMNYDNFIYYELIRIVKQLRTQNYNYQDMAVLVRGNDLGAKLAAILLEAGIPAISNESLLLDRNNEIGFLLAILRYLTDHKDEVSRLEMLNFIAVKQNLPQEKSFLLAQKNNHKDFLHFFRELGFLFYPKKLLHCDLYTRIEKLLQIFELSKDANPFILAFLDIVADFTLKNQRNESQFLKFWEEKKNKFSLSNPNGINAINVMTVHQSKGLEFPIVILPQKRKTNKPVKKWINLSQPIAEMNTILVGTSDLKDTSLHDIYEQEKQENALDELNINYVAFTRAKERLYCIAQQGETFGDDLAIFFKNQLAVQPIREGNSSIEYYQFGDFTSHKIETVALNNSSIQIDDIKPITSKICTPRISKSRHDDLFHPQQDIGASVAWGIDVHEYLSRIQYHKDIEVIKKQIEQENVLTLQQKESLLNIINNLFKGEYNSLLFGCRGNAVVKTEVSILDETGQLYRLDRLCIEDYQCIIFDYKTGSSNVEHIEQINIYSEILSAMGFVVKGKYIVYIKESLEIEFCHIQ